MTHVKLVASSKKLKVPRKEKVWTLSTAPGPHKKAESMPLGTFIREYLGLADNRKEMRYILNEKTVLVDGARARDERMPIGIFDIVSFPEIEKYYVITVDHRARLIEKGITKAGTEIKLCKLTGKTMLKGGKLQLNLYDGKNILVDAKDSKKYSVGDTLAVKIPELKIAEVLPIEKGKVAMVSKGRHAGKVGKIIEITKAGLNLKSLTTVECPGETITTSTAYIYVIGDKMPK